MFYTGNVYNMKNIYTNIQANIRNYMYTCNFKRNVKFFKLKERTEQKLN